MFSKINGGLCKRNNLDGFNTKYIFKISLALACVRVHTHERTQAPKKSSNLRPSWTRRYFVVHTYYILRCSPALMRVHSIVMQNLSCTQLEAPGRLKYFKQDFAHDTAAPAGVVDLRLVIGVKLHTHGQGGKDATRIDLELADRTYKLRCADSDETLAWIQALHDWRDYSIDHEAHHPISEHSHDHDEDTIGAVDTMDEANAASVAERINTAGPSHSFDVQMTPIKSAAKTAQDKVDMSGKETLVRKQSIMSSTKPQPLSGNINVQKHCV